MHYNSGSWLSSRIVPVETGFAAVALNYISCFELYYKNNYSLK